MSAFLHPIPPSDPWVSPVFVPTARMRRKDRDFLDLRMHEELRMAVADRWGVGPVFDMNPSGAFYDMVPNSAHPAYLPPAPEWPYPITPAGYPRRGRGSFAGETKPGQRIVEQVKTLFAKKDSSMVDEARRKAGQILAPQAPPVSFQTASQRQESVATTVLAAGAITAVAFGVGFLVGRMTSSR